MRSFRYSRWDGAQAIDPFTAQEVMDHIADKMLDGSDLRSVLRDLLQRGAALPSGRQMAGLRDLLERLRKQRLDQLRRYNLDSVMEDIQQQLDRVIQTEREGIEQRLAESRATAGDDGERQQLRDLLERMARRHLEQLDRLPSEAGGRIQHLRDYDFMDPAARQQFQDLLERLQRQVLEQVFQGIKQGLDAMTPEALGQMQQMVRDLNRLLDAHRRGDDSGFQDFMDQWGQFFPDGIQSVDELAQHLQQQMAQMQSLLDAMTPAMRRELNQLISQLMPGDLKDALADLAEHLAQLYPNRGGQGLSFTGDEPITLQEAMRLMRDLQGMEALERDLLESVRTSDAARLDLDAIRHVLGEEARRLAEELQGLTRLLEDAGLVRRDGETWELTARALRKIAARALEQIFDHIDRGLTGDHTTDRNGWGVERLDETRPHVFGDAFAIDLPASLKNAVRREGRGTPVTLRADDFEVYRTAAVDQCSTVILLDMSGSMHRRGYFPAARKVALALDSLIRTRFPRDVLYVAAFSSVVRPLTSRMLLETWWIETHGTDFVEALRAGRALLKRHQEGSRQIILITDGQPRGAGYGWGWGWGYGYGAWDEDRAVRLRNDMEATLQEVARCTKDRITVNTFMLDTAPETTAFVRAMTKLNRGRAFFADPHRLGDYLIEDYLKHRRTRR